MKWAEQIAYWANVVTLLGFPLAVFTWFFTRESFSKFWKKRGKLIFSILGVLALYGVWRFGGFNWLSYRISIGWMLAGIALLVVIAGIILWFLSLKPSEGSPNLFANWKDYVDDEIFGVRWSWKYIHNQIDEDYFSAFCPRRDCRHRLDFKDDYDRARYDAARAPVTLSCPRCGFKHEFDWNRQDLLRRVAGEVERRINTGEFTEANKRVTSISR